MGTSQPLNAIDLMTLISDNIYAPISFLVVPPDLGADRIKPFEMFQ